MPLDFGQTRKHGHLRGLGWALLLGVVLIGVLLVFNWRGHRAQERSEGWVGAAPACPRISEAAYRAHYAGGERITVYNGVALARQFGHVMCKDVDTEGAFGFVTHPVCQFTSPTAIRVAGPSGMAYFEPGSGHVATVSVERRRTVCQLRGEFTLFKDPTQLGSVAP
ncbi:MAG: hypothetical protein JSR98_20915 [Proteobacteria bacterium]|nr:hypothetical protein [Pseudomonadota bacterium]